MSFDQAIDTACSSIIHARQFAFAQLPQASHIKRTTSAIFAVFREQPLLEQIVNLCVESFEHRAQRKRL